MGSEGLSSRTAEIVSGDRRRALEAMRAELAEKFVEAPPTVIAQIAARLQAVLKELDELPGSKKVTVSDDLARRRADRRAAARAAASAGGESL